MVTKKFGVRPNTDKALRASYTPSPKHRTPGGTRTPSLVGTPTSGAGTPGAGTPKSGESTPKASVTPKRKVPASITDDLLQLPKRPKASEFF